MIKVLDNTKFTNLVYKPLLHFLNQPGSYTRGSLVLLKTYKYRWIDKYIHLEFIYHIMQQQYHILQHTALNSQDNTKNIMRNCFRSGPQTMTLLAMLKGLIPPL